VSFAVWITGPPAAGKSTLAAALRRALEARGLRPAVLESDEARRHLTPRPRYDEEERETFYGALVWIGSLLTDRGVPVLFDATAHRRRWRDRARRRIPRFLEVYVTCPPDVRRARDPKGLYRRAAEGRAPALPGAGAPYEPPESPDLVVRGDRDDPDEAAVRVLRKLVARGYLR
jgi:adenylylsulfate kinase